MALVAAVGVLIILVVSVRAVRAPAVAPADQLVQATREWTYPIAGLGGSP